MATSSDNFKISLNQYIWGFVVALASIGFPRESIGHSDEYRVIRFGFLVWLLGTLLLTIGGFSCLLLFLYALYLLFAESIGIGLKAIGAAVVAGIIVWRLSGMLMARGVAVLTRAAAAQNRENRG